jgi:hypothetical protein
MSRNLDEALAAGDTAGLRNAIARDMSKGAAYTAALVSVIGVFIWVCWGIGHYLLPEQSQQAVDPTFEGYWTSPD